MNTIQRTGRQAMAAFLALVGARWGVTSDGLRRVRGAAAWGRAAHGDAPPARLHLPADSRSGAADTRWFPDTHARPGTPDLAPVLNVRRPPAVTARLQTVPQGGTLTTAARPEQDAAHLAWGLQHLVGEGLLPAETFQRALEHLGSDCALDWGGLFALTPEVARSVGHWSRCPGVDAAPDWHAPGPSRDGPLAWLWWAARQEGRVTLEHLPPGVRRSEALHGVQALTTVALGQYGGETLVLVGLQWAGQRAWHDLDHVLLRSVGQVLSLALARQALELRLTGVDAGQVIDVGSPPPTPELGRPVVAPDLTAALTAALDDLARSMPGVSVVVWRLEGGGLRPLGSAGPLGADVWFSFTPGCLVDWLRDSGVLTGQTALTHGQALPGEVRGAGVCGSTVVPVQLDAAGWGVLLGALTHGEAPLTTGQRSLLEAAALGLRAPLMLEQLRQSR